MTPVTDNSAAPTVTVSPAEGRDPTRTPTARFIGVFLALLLLTLGVVALRDTAVAVGRLDGAQWLTSLASAIDGFGFQWWWLPVGVVSALAGIWCIGTAVRPRPKFAARVKAGTSQWMSPQSVARLSSHAAGAVPGALSVRSTATRRKVVVVVVPVDVATADQTKNDVAEAVSRALGVLQSPQRVTVRIGKGGQ
ncbi:MAG: DUF6286 domain-containing protein [Mycobacterium sp.]